MIIVGEKINASRADVGKMINERDAEGLAQLALSQAQAGADFVDVNVGTGEGQRQDEADSMGWAVKVVSKAVEKPICVDSADPMVIEAGLRALDSDGVLVNSAKAEDDTLEAVVNLAAAHNGLLVGLAMDESGIPPTSDGRLKACAKIVDACSKIGVPLKRVFFDPLALPVSTDTTQGLVTLETISRIKNEFPGARTVMGLSNISYGLPARGKLNTAFLYMALYAGLDAAIADPLNEDLMAGVKAGEVLVGKDRHCRRYMRSFR